MALIKKDKAGSAPGYVWEKDGDVVEVTDADLATELTHIPDGGFTEVIPEVTEPAPEKKVPEKKVPEKKVPEKKVPEKKADATSDDADKAKVTEPAPEDEKAVEES